MYVAPFHALETPHERNEPVAFRYGLKTSHTPLARIVPGFVWNPDSNTRFPDASNSRAFADIQPVVTARLVGTTSVSAKAHADPADDVVTTLMFL